MTSEAKEPPLPAAAKEPPIPAAAESSGGGAAATVNTQEDRLARKAASARLARARHKNSVQSRQEEVATLHSRIAVLEAEHLERVEAASSQLRSDLRAALPDDRWKTLCSWLAPPEPQPPPAEQLLYQLAISAAAEPAAKPAAKPATKRTSREGPRLAAGAPSTVSASARAALHATETKSRRIDGAGGPSEPPAASSTTASAAPLFSTPPMLPSAPPGARAASPSHGKVAPSLLHAVKTAGASSQEGSAAERGIEEEEESPTTVLHEELMECALGLIGVAQPKERAVEAAE